MTLYIFKYIRLTGVVGDKQMEYYSTLTACYKDLYGLDKHS